MLDQIRPTVSVLVLGTDHVLTYRQMSPRQALVTAYVQFTRHDFATWNLERHWKEFGNQVATGPSGKSASFYDYATTLN